MPAIARGVIGRRRRCAPSKWPVVADINPDVTLDRLALGQNRHGGVIAMQSLSSEHVALDQRVKRLQDRSTCADLVGQRRYAQLDALAAVAFALPVERLVLAELLEQDHGQQIGSGKAPWGHMERRRRLGDRLAFPA